MQSNWPRSATRIYEPIVSNETACCIWNVVLCFFVIFWRWKTEAKAETENLIQFRFCFLVLLINTVFSLVLSSSPHGWKHQVKLFLKYGLGSIVVIHVLCVLFGAPFLKYWNQTISFSMLLSALFLPSVTACGKLGNFFDFSNFDWMGRNELFTCLGAWLGAFVIPLDWDRPWQVWPEPVGVGAVVGCGLGSLLKVMRSTINAAGYQMYWPTKLFVHERHV
ncbi:hypothetical protein GHT06_020281 [Daphnia sinensis]|uniref:Phosphatidylinositol-glycan biosynthesis class F protein n=1 Tax=Daphnia sinensis TaxID=1820382 RepID=A0AAD5KMD8_9CRUS|nr:hypothetical protein GHT06_020281 [Daphnia sinensis]